MGIAVGKAPIDLVHIRHSVGQTNGLLIIRGKLFGPIQQPWKNAAGCGLGGQAKKHAVRPGFLQKLFRRQRRFRFAGAHLGFHNHQPRRNGILCNLKHRLLHGIGRRRQRKKVRDGYVPDTGKIVFVVL